MMIALAESLLERGGVDAKAIAHAFVDAYDPRRGYGSGTSEVLRLVRAGVNSHEAAGAVFGGQGSLGNGAAMHIAPVAVCYADAPAALASAARASARVTHPHPLAIDAAVVQATAIAAALTRRPPFEAALDAATTSEPKGRLSKAAQLHGVEPAAIAEALGNRSTGHESMPAAIYPAVAHESAEAAISFAVRCGGDTDTIGAMTGAIAAARFGASTLPERWTSVLEQGPKGRGHGGRLGELLLAAARDA
jgi:poly(ADP-ribose) glycohydrolase ARH3